jgi:hypothetical protein
MKLITVDSLKRLLHYDPLTGVFTVLTKAPRRKVGDVAGCYCRGYLRIHIGGFGYQAHRLAWLYVYGDWPKHDIDHINGIRDDNRIANLRDVPKGINIQNQKAAHHGSQSGLLGVSWNKRKWRAKITLNGQIKYLGHYDNKYEAHEAYLKAKRQMHEGCTI